MPLSIFAGMKAPETLERYDFSPAEQEFLFSQIPLLIDHDIAETVIELDDDKTTFKLFSETTNAVFVITKPTNSDEELTIDQTFVELEMQPRIFEGKIQDTLFEAMMMDTGSEKIAKQITDAFKEEFTTAKGIRREARYSLEVTEYFYNGRFIKYGDVLKAKVIVDRAAEEKILKQDLDTLSWSLVDVESEKTFYAPVRSSRVSSLFQFNRRHPVKKRFQPHNGIDFVAPSGTPVYPALSGVVVSMGRTRAKGKFVLIEHENGYQTTYDHLRKFQKGLSVGKYVELDDQIGEVGRTGFATGAHLHFGVLSDGLYVNPLNLLKDYTFAQKDLFETADLEE